MANATARLPAPREPAPSRGNLQGDRQANEGRVAGADLRRQDDGGGADRAACRLHLHPRPAILGFPDRFIVSQPRESGAVLAKSFYRLIGTLIGAAMSLFLGLAVCPGAPFVSGRAGAVARRLLAALSMREALPPTALFCPDTPRRLSAFPAYSIQTTPFTLPLGAPPKFCLGIIIAATLHHIVLPNLLIGPLCQAIDGARQLLADYPIALCEGAHTTPIRAKLFSQIIAVENLLASAIFEDREIRERGRHRPSPASAAS